jgi:hypothetical protein
MLEKLYDAFIASDTPEDKARAAAVEGAEPRDQVVNLKFEIADVRSVLRLHSWMLGTLIAGVLLLLGLSLRQTKTQEFTPIEFAAANRVLSSKEAVRRRGEPDQAANETQNQIVGLALLSRTEKTLKRHHRNRLPNSPLPERT